MRRWLIWLVIGVALLLLVAVAIVQGVLASDIPRRLVRDQLQQQTGLTIHIDELETGWLGRTRVQGLTAALPLADKPFLNVPRARLGHTDLLRLVLGRPLTIQRLSVRNPHLTLQQEKSGNWNLEQVIAGLTGPEAAEDAEDADDLELPSVELSGARVEIRQPERTFQVSDIGFRLNEAAAGGHAISLTVPELLELEGRIAGGWPWTQNLRATLAPDADWLGRMLAPQLTSASANLRWEGTMRPGRLVGSLWVEPLNVPDPGLKLQGRSRVTVNMQTGETALSPRTVQITAADRLPEPLQLTGGHLRYRKNQLFLNRLNLVGFGGQARLNGQFDPDTVVGDLTVEWGQLQQPAGLTHSGSITLDISRRRPGQRAIEADVQATGQSPLGPWEGRFGIDVAGRAWDQLTGTLTLRRLAVRYQGERYRLHDLGAEVVVAAPELHLNELRPLEEDLAEQVSGQGRLNWQKGDYQLQLAAQRLDLPNVPLMRRIELAITGDTQGTTLERGRLRMAGVNATATGSYRPGGENRQRPLNGTINLNQIPLQLQRTTQALLRAENLEGQLNIAGGLDPLDLEATGQLTAVNLQAREEQLGDIALRLQAQATPDGVQFKTRELELLGGEWGIAGRYEFTPVNRRQHRLKIAGENLDLARLSRAMTGQTLAEGTGRLMLSGRGESLALEALEVTGEAAARDARLGPVAVDQLKSQVRMANGRVRLHGLSLHQGNAGRVTGELAFPLTDLQSLNLEVKADRWRLPLGPVELEAGGHIAGQMNIAERRGDLSGQLEAGLVTRDGDPLADLQAELALEGTRLRIKPVGGNLLGGRISGTGNIPLNRLQQSELNIHWSSAQPGELAPLFAPLQRVEGTFSGSLAIVPEPNRRASGPVRAELTFRPQQGRYGRIELGSTEVTAHIDWPGWRPAEAEEPTTREGRIVLSDLSSELSGGRINLWGRLSQHAGQWHLFGSGQVKGLRLGPVTETFLSEEETVLGRLEVSQLMVTTPLNNWQAAVGEGRLQVSESDFGEIPLFAGFYNLMNVRLGQQEPEGAGEAAFRIEEGGLTVNRLQYRNRGLSIRFIRLGVDDLWAGDQSPIRGYALASLSPLPELPGLGMFNQALARIQEDATTIEISGSLAEPRLRTMALQGVQDALGALLGGEGDDEDPPENEPENAEPRKPANQPQQQPDQ